MTATGRPPGVVVRPARPEEAGTVAELFNGINSIGRDAPPVTMTAEHVRRHLLGADPWAVLLVGELDEVVAGFVTASPSAPPAASSSSIFTSRPRRGDMGWGAR
jgi:hypothetical protein